MADTPNKAALERGMTVVVDQTGADEDELIGEVGAVLEDESTHPDGVLVKLKSGVTGRVKRIGEP
ncbi:DUF2196 domain-containing protein [Haloplanus sp. C73]|uniref:DUF2196 domain-containing protein n=1 Tax=Haloplanus sp. C73 TaxID=3421641 RepID=UPI003EB7403C